MNHIKARISFLILFLAVLPFFSGCPNNFTAEKTGSFSLIINEVNDVNPRTILPDTPLQSGFAEYTLNFIPVVDGEALTVSRINTNLSNPVNLKTGTYNLRVTAYITGEEETKPVATGLLEGVMIDAGASVTHRITLKALIEAGSGAGTFSWNIEFPSGLSEASMKITPINTATSTPEQTLYFEGVEGSTPNTGKTGSLELNIGYYRVLFTLRKAGAQAIERREILHIYQNMVSAWPLMEFTNGHFNNTHYTVTFVYNDETTPGLPQDRTHGETAMRPAPDPERDGYTFALWYGDIDLSTPYDFDTPLIGDISLYAKWIKHQDVLTINGGNITKTYGDEDFTLTLSGGSGTGAISYLIISGEDVINVDSNTGLVTILNAGEAVIKAAKEGDANYNDTDSEPITITVEKRSLAFDMSSSNITLTPLPGETSATVSVTLSGNLLDKDTAAISYTATSGIGLTENEGIYTLTYNGTAVFSNPSVAINFLANAGENYTVAEAELSVSVYDGRADYTGAEGTYDRRIPVTAANILTFNTYARTTGTNGGLGRHYKLIQNAALPAVDPKTSNWTAIGSSGSNNAFTGSFDGQDHTISNLTISTTSSYQGMFGYIGSGGTVRNIGLINSTITNSQSYLGGITGYNSGTVRNCYVTGSVTSNSTSQNYLGGIAGYNSGTVESCYVTGNINDSSRTYVGGITGTNSGTVRNCYVTGNVTGSNNTGGIVGENRSSGTIGNCYITGNVKGYINSSNNVGGVVGNNSGITENCVALMENVFASSSTSNIGRVTGINSGTLTNNHAWERITLQSSGISPPALVTSNIDQAAKNGANLTTEDVKLYTWWTNTSPNGAGFTFAAISTNGWKWTDDKMPHLFNDDLWDWPVYVTVGTENNPFLVATVEDLQHIGKPNPTDNGGKYAYWTLTAYYKQTANIDLTSAGNWTPIGNNSNRFIGGFDGDEYTITGLTISSGRDQGLFSYIGNGGIVKNVGLIGGNITSSSYSGGIAGSNNGMIQNCYNTGNVGGGCTGGIVGMNNSTGIIENSYTTGNVSSDDSYYSGGIAGNNSGTIRNCYATGHITGQGNNGGLVGDNSGGIIQNCYTTGNITSRGTVLVSSNTGGIAGRNNYGGSIQNCYATGDVTGYEYVGGIVGINTSGTVLNSIASNNSVIATSNTTSVGRVVGYADTQTNNYAWERMTVRYNTSINKTLAKGTSAVDGSDFTLAAAKSQAGWTMAGFTFNTTNWKWTEGRMPHLFDNDLRDWPPYVTDLGTESNPFLVETVEDLQHVGKPSPADNDGKYARWTLDSYYKQTADIDLSGISNWTPIGTSSNRFVGCFDGNKHIIIGLTITSGSDQGLFSHIGRGGTVKNVGLVGGSITNSSYSGGVVGYNYGTVDNCYNTGNVSGSGYLGGIVGGNNGIIENCYTTGNITGTSNFVGGIAGSNSGSIKNCYAVGEVLGNNANVGGIAGYNDNSRLENCIALNSRVKANSSATTQIGRVTAYYSNPGTLINNYARESGMTITANNNPVTVTSSATGIHGENVSAVDYDGANSGTWWRDTALFPDTEWNFAANKLPTLKNAGGTQNPAVP